MTAEAPKTRWTPGDEIRKARREAKLEQDELATLVGVSRKTISMWENGHTEPTISQWRTIAHKTDAPWLLTGGGGLLTYGDTTDNVSYAPFAVVDESQGRLNLEPFPPSRTDPTLTLVGVREDAGGGH